VDNRALALLYRLA